ncbi:NAD(P)H-dependent oxidoreductase [Sphingobacterium sp. lm-10]|uniref:NADPH-dependent FMN reductase n=1 Tax=Sphingobacterium sp. lm-10 TaxID=2944904 RepID=UPI00202292D4|nr:NAD(P)H-dependent oxidoreductase [Sphingobacterium sp. lm-10]MCL7989468.1 NAD(P)H-dependent oxidoreductase [Sphingobacterium sp. lm-10]
MDLIIVGTNRPKNNSTRVAQYYQQELSRKGQDWNILSLDSLPSDIIVSDLYGRRSDAFAPIQQSVSEARRFIFIIPEYNGSYPGILKVFMDACAYPASFYHKKAALVGISTGKYGNVRGIDHFTGVCHYMRMHVMALKIHLPHIQNELNEQDQFSDPLTEKYVQEQLADIERL